MSKFGRNICTDFDAVKCMGALYTGGHVEWVEDLIFTSANAGTINVVQNGCILHTIDEEEDPAINFTAAKDSDKVTLITAHKSGLLRIFAIVAEAPPEIMKTFRSIHTGPIAFMKMHVWDSGGRVLATGGTDGTVKVWDLTQQYYTHNLRTGSGVCSVVELHPNKFMAVTGFQTGGLHLWDLVTSKQTHQLEGHYSTVTATKILVEKDELLSAGRDKVVILWDLKLGAKKKIVPVGCSVEGMHHITGHTGKHTGNLRVLLATEDVLAVWDLEAPKKIDQIEVGSEISRLASQNNSVFCSTIDQNLVEIDTSDLKVRNTVVGNNDEILDLAYVGADDSHLVVTCNSSTLRVYKVADYSCVLVRGHKDTVMCVRKSSLDPDIVCTGGKDREIKVWRLVGDSLECVITATGHTEAVHGVVFVQQSLNQLYSVSKDTTVKSWRLDYDNRQMVSVRTEIAHEKEINCCDITPDDELIATGSQDKTCKLWDKQLALVATLRGHKRGIWCARFSPHDRLLATGSADAVIKLWSLGNGGEFPCVKQLEGHDCSVLSLCWLSDEGQQICSSATDGLIKVWWVARQECVATLERHQDKVWSVVTRKEDGVVKLTSGSANGQLITWTDVTEEATLKKQEEADKLVLGQQKLANLLATKQFGEALTLALRLGQPFTALKVLKRVNLEEMEAAVLSLDKAELDQLLGYTVKWNTNSRHCEAAQSVLNIILTNHLPEDLIKLSGSRDWVEGLLPYTEKHFNRLSRLQMKSKFLTFLIANMKATSLPQIENEL